MKLDAQRKQEKYKEKIAKIIIIQCVMRSYIDSKKVQKMKSMKTHNIFKEGNTLGKSLIPIFV